MKIRIRFKKEGVLRFIGHLDVMRYFQKAMRRANIPILYSSGYSPHQIMSFASPLGVGLTSEGEYMDIEVASIDSSEDCMNRLNTVMAEGMEVLSYKVLDDKSKTAMSIVSAADYMVGFRPGKEPFENWQESFSQFINQETILIEKQTKKSTRMVDLKPHIHMYSIHDEKIMLRLTAGSSENIKPELIFEAFYQANQMTMPAYALSIHRLDLLTDIGEDDTHSFISLDDMGQVI